MPVILTTNKTTPYPVREFDKFNPYHSYFLIRKDVKSILSKNIAELKVVDEDVLLTYLDSNYVWKLGDTSYGIDELIIPSLMNEFDIIEITDEDTSTNSLSGTTGYDYEKAYSIRKSVIDKLFLMVEERLRKS